MSAAAFFDVDGTIVRGNIVSYYARMRTAEMPAIARWLWVISYLPRCLYYFLLDRKGRRRFNEVFYRSYARFAPEELKALARWHFRHYLKPHVYEKALERIRWHQSQGHEVVLVTGSIAPVLDPLAEWLQADEVFAADLEKRDGRYTGRLSKGPVTDRVKAESVRTFAAEREFDLGQCYAYADSFDDVPMLEAVGHPAAVNPGGRLERVARKRSWEVLKWKRLLGERDGER